MLKENKKAVSPDFYLQPSIYIYMFTSYTARYIYYHYSTSKFLPVSPGVSSRHPGSHPSTPHASVCMCIHTHTQHIHINSLLKMGRHFSRPNESLTLETNANRRLAGKTPLTPLLHTHAMVFKTPVNSAENTCWAYIRKKKMTTTK